MNRLAIILIPCILLIFSCSSKQEKKEPAILKGKVIDVASILKKRGKDPVDLLYEELVSNSEELQELEDQFKKLQDNSTDSLEAYKLFNEKNSSYYSSADNKIASISDSSIRRKIRSLLNRSRYNYLDTVSNWNALDSTVARRTTTLNDLHTLLKLIKTLPLIEEFQKSHAPSGTPALGIVREYDSIINRLDTLTVIVPPAKPIAH
jgi:hypothetical protein